MVQKGTHAALLPLGNAQKRPKIINHMLLRNDVGATWDAQMDVASISRPFQQSIVVQRQGTFPQSCEAILQPPWNHILEQCDVGKWVCV